MCDYLPSDSIESCLATEVPSLVLKLKADNNPWNCDCEMKVLYDHTSKSVLKLPNLTCKEPSKYENQHWEVLKDADCSTSVSPTVIQTTEDSVSVSMTSSSSSSSDRNSSISKHTEKPVDNNIGPVQATSSVVWIVITSISAVLTLGLIVLFIWLDSKMRRLRSDYARLRDRLRQESQPLEMPFLSTSTNRQEIIDSACN
jgi:hypothetical protein